MYGYLRTHVPELKVREQEYYRAVYCGLCRTMGKCTGQCSRMTLSYDFTLFALVRMALTGETVTVRSRRCMAHPLRKRPMAESTPALRLCAYASAILAHHKVKDDLRDERGLKRTAATVLSPFTASMRRRAVKEGYGDMDSGVCLTMKEMWEMETSRLPSVDGPASLFGELMGKTLAYGLEGNTAKLAHAVGLHLGRFVYILDAADDYAEDMEKGRYNPLACLYGDPAMTQLSDRKRQELKIALLNELTELEKAFDLLDTTDYPDLGGILSNILYEGLPRQVERVLFGSASCDCSQKGKSKKRRHSRRSERKGEQT
jgi:hypothetical protein